MANFEKKERQKSNYIASDKIVFTRVEGKSADLDTKDGEFFAFTGTLIDGQDKYLITINLAEDGSPKMYAFEAQENRKAKKAFYGQVSKFKNEYATKPNKPDWYKKRSSGPNKYQR